MISLKSLILESDGYKGEHEAPGNEGCPLYDLRINSVYPKDVYETLYQYAIGDEHDERSLSNIRRCKGDPEAYVWMYRAVPTDIYQKAVDNQTYYGIIRVGDWVTIVKSYAVEHSLGLTDKPDVMKVVSRRVKAKDLWTDGNSIHEWGYNPS